MKLLAGLTVKAGTKIELPATVTGKPEPQITWTKADMLLKQDKRITIENVPKKSTVTIMDSKRSDTGTYIIEAVNVCGRATAVVEVNVLGKGGSCFQRGATLSATFLNKTWLHFFLYNSIHR